MDTKTRPENALCKTVIPMRASILLTELLDYALLTSYTGSYWCGLVSPLTVKCADFITVCALHNFLRSRNP